VPEAIEPQLSKHKQRMAAAEARITADVETAAGKNLADVTTEQFDSVPKAGTSLEYKAVHGKMRRQRLWADKLKRNSADLKARYQAWAAAGFPDADVVEFLGVVGLREVQ